MGRNGPAIIIIFKDGQRRDVSVKQFYSYATPDHVLEDLEKHFPELKGIRNFDYKALVDGRPHHEKEMLGSLVTVLKIETKMPAPDPD